jgi:hypothetical protein
MKVIFSSFANFLVFSSHTISRELFAAKYDQNYIQRIFINIGNFFPLVQSHNFHVNTLTANLILHMQSVILKSD